jgi:hypothetical protein
LVFCPPDISRRGLALMRREEGAWDFVGADSEGEGIQGKLGSLEILAVVGTSSPRVRIEYQLPATQLRASIRDDDGGDLVHLSCVRRQPVIAVGRRCRASLGRCGRP